MERMVPYRSVLEWIGTYSTGVYWNGFCCLQQGSPFARVEFLVRIASNGMDGR